MNDGTPARPRVVVEEPHDGRRRVRIDGEDVGVVVNAEELRRLLTRTGLTDEDTPVDDPRLIDWQGGGPDDWPAA
ncbi:hypothetical protein [Streptomyces botrytidirepellens]|uniref:Uncharacterized protein n=1 Tax=Streptomyces botrytidirepellens TaxID=2486417 RepID=A0A3M8VJN8_9ACTN|nr:hypothetical protein [Streptomyces botrytidirepellens]RNG16625.1 hypothetical protein EEJ42_30610 [Streptomyces botrytidirepellens]